MAYVRELKKEELWENYEGSYGAVVGDKFALHPSLVERESLETVV